MQAARVRVPAPVGGWQHLIVPLVATRIGLVVSGLIGLAVMPASSRRVDYLPDLPWLSIFIQWDAVHYIDVAVRGYTFEPGRLPTIPFFPLYPWLMRVTAGVFGPVTEASAAVAGLLIANVALLVALLYLVELVARDVSLTVARRSVLYLLTVPTTLFLSAAYAESLFVATAVACLYHARQGEWYRAGLSGALGALTRPFGALLLVPLVIEMIGQRPQARAWPALALVPAGLGVYFAHLWQQFGDPFVYFRANLVWGRELTPPWEALAGYLRGPLQLYDWPYSVLDLVSVVLMVILAALAWRLLPRSYAAFTTLGVLFLVSSGTAWFSASRHALGFFPLVLVLAVLGERRAFHWPWLVGSAALAASFMARFAAGHWVA